MNFEFVIEILNSFLTTSDPKVFNSSWIYFHAPCCYRYIWKYIRTDLGDIDWDKVIARLERGYQKRWTRKIPKRVKQYRNSREVNVVIKRYIPKLYIFISSLDDEDKALRNIICISLVRVAQKGNIIARDRLTELLRYIVDQWIDHCYVLKRWQGYSDDIVITIHQCIRCYRFTGSFLGYLFKTLEYRGRGLRPFYAYSVDDYMYGTKERLINNVI